MAFPYRKIFCPVDFDQNSLSALDEAIEIARHFDAKVALVHVIPQVLQSIDLYEDQEKAARARLDEIARQKLGGIQHEWEVRIGDVVGIILRAIDRFEPDLLVMATHGRRGLEHFFLGSVAEAVVRRASCPVLTIRTELSAATKRH